MISVIIPCFNNAALIGKCVESVLAQTFTDFEIIVVDDGSDDDVFAALAHISDPRLRRPIKISHAGVSAARNIGIFEARGEYCVFIDGDDWVEPNHLQVLYDGLALADMALIEMIIDYSDGRSEINPFSHSIFEKKGVINRSEFNSLFATYLLSSPCNKIYKTDLLKGSNYLFFDTGISYAEDLLFNLEYCLHINSIAVIPSVTYHYVKHKSSGTGRYHRNTGYTLERLTKAVGDLTPQFSDNDKRILADFLLWGIHNIHHRDSDLTDLQKIAAVGQILAIPALRDSMKTGLSKTGISKKYRLILATKSPWLIHKAFASR